MENNNNLNKITGKMYAIFRVGEKKFKSIKEVEGFQKHMDRTFKTPNADPKIKNEVLIGDSKIVENVKKYIEGIKLRSNGVLARDLLLTASPEFFKQLTTVQKREWINLNIKFLNDNFGDKILYAVLHKDETTYHIHALLVPRFYDKKKDKCVLANKRLFDGKEVLSQWQDIYSSAMKEGFKQLNRGIKNSKATHIKIRHFYTLLNEKYDSKDYQKVIAKAKNEELLRKKINDYNKTLEAYKNFIDKKEKSLVEKEKAELRLKMELAKVKANKEQLKETVKAISEIYHIPQKSIIEILRRVEEKDKSIDSERELKK